MTYLKKNLLFGIHFQISRFYSSFIAWLQYSIHELILIFNDHIKRPICQDKTLIRTHLFVSEATNHIDINTKSVISKAMWWWWSCRIGKKAGKPLTHSLRLCVNIWKCDIAGYTDHLKGQTRTPPAMFVATKPGLFANSFRWVFVPKPHKTISTVLSEDKMENEPK